MDTSTARVRQLLLLLLLYDHGRLSGVLANIESDIDIAQDDKGPTTLTGIGNGAISEDGSDVFSLQDIARTPSSLPLSLIKNLQQSGVERRGFTSFLRALVHQASSAQTSFLHPSSGASRAHEESFIFAYTQTLSTTESGLSSFHAREQQHAFPNQSTDVFQNLNTSTADQFLPSAPLPENQTELPRSFPVNPLNSNPAFNDNIDDSNPDWKQASPNSHGLNASSVGDNFSNGANRSPHEEGLHTLHIGGLFELSSRDGPNGYSELDAALLAIDHINGKQIIPGYKLRLLYNDSRCDAGYGIDAFFDLIKRKSKERSLVMMMGSACSEVTKTVAEIVPYWNLILVSYAETSPALREREKYRTFFTLALGDSALNPARRMLVKHFKWDKVAALYEDHESLSLAFNDINKDFTAHDIVIKSSTSFKDVKVEVPGKLKEMMDLDVRIILAGFKEPAARQVFCQAYQLGMYAPRYVWILVGLLKSSWWTDVQDTACTVQEMATAVEGTFIIFSLNGLLDGGKSVANLTSGEFIDAYINASGSLPMSVFAASTYDTIWTMALTLRQATAVWAENGTAPLLHRLSYDDMGDVKETFISTMETLEFPGVSGPVSFKGSGREGVTAVYQIQAGNFTQVAIHQPGSNHLDFICESCHKIYWKDDRIPKDEQIVVARPKTIDMYVFFTSSGLCVLGVVMAVCFLTYNLYHRKLKYIKLSSPKLNNVAVIGCILVYLAVIMMGLDDRTLSEEIFPIVCTVRAFLLAAGFSLAFGAMFAKTFRVHQIFTRAHHGLVKSKLIQDTHLLVIIGVLLAVDSSLVLVWVLVDPMSRLVSNTTIEVSAEDEDLIFQEQLTTCHSSHLQKWLGAFYAYKGLLLIFGVYMAWETRRVKIPALNDSKYIGLNVYNVVIMSVSVVVISNILSSQPTLAYAMESAFMFLSTTVTLCLLFVPKIYALVTSGGNPVIACTGILVDNTNTRRFVFDDRKEIYYRAEVQNRVYKRELVELDQKVERLERLLELPNEPYPALINELIYFLPEDGTPGCLRRYKRHLDRYSSISDGGEGVLYEDSESDDILTEMGFTTVHKPADPPKKCPEHGRKSMKKLHALTRSWSIGAGSRIRKKRQSLEQPKTLFQLSSCESNFMDSIYGGKGENDLSPNDVAYLYSDILINSSVVGVHSLLNATVPMVDKITQTTSAIKETKKCASGAIRLESESSGDNAYGRVHHKGLQLRGRLPLLNSKQGKLFAVHRLHVEMVEEDSNSNNEDADSLAASSGGCLSPCNELCIERQAETKIIPEDNYTEQNFQHFHTATCNKDYLMPSNYRRNGEENVRRLSAPNPLYHGADFSLPLASTSLTSSTTRAPPTTPPLCLSTSLNHLPKDKQELSSCDFCLNYKSSEFLSPGSSSHASPNTDSSRPFSNGASSEGKMLEVSFSLCPSTSTSSLRSNESHNYTNSPLKHNANYSKHQTSYTQLFESPKENQPARGDHTSPLFSSYSLQAVQSRSQTSTPLASTSENVDGKLARQSSTRDSRRERIKKLQEDLAMIQLELEELTTNDSKTSEV